VQNLNKMMEGYQVENINDSYSRLDRICRPRNFEWPFIVTATKIYEYFERGI
jgi:hypothetical protein